MCASPSLTPPTIVWFRQDLRLADNPALSAAAAAGPVIALYILDETPSVRPLGAATKWWLDKSLQALDKSLGAQSVPLTFRRGKAEEVLALVIAETGARSVVWNRCYEPGAIKRDQAIKQSLKNQGVEVHSFNASLLVEPWEIKTGGGDPYRVFTPFWRTLSARNLPGDIPAVPKLALGPDVKSEKLADWRLHPSKPDWSHGMAEFWTPGEEGAREQLADFVDDGLAHYADDRNRPDRPGSSRLSPYLHFGEIGPRQIWRTVSAAADAHPKLDRAAGSFLREIGWREFSYHLLFHFDHLPDRALRTEFDRFPWVTNQAHLQAWQRGLTGYPLVDAGMRQLWQTGWMHNRVRMVVASFLVKHLLQDWRAGEAWFWDTLVDADLANNAASWQWVAGSGADAAPYFRIMNPVLQGEKFDPDGAYIREFVPELAGLPDKYLNTPWLAPEETLKTAGITLGETYPHPLVDHSAARQRALAAFDTVKSRS